MSQTSTWLLLYLTIAENLALDLKKFKQFTIPPASWQSSQTFSEVKTLVSCGARALNADLKFFVFDYSAKSCDIGSVDLGSMSGEATMQIMGAVGSMAGIPWLCSHMVY